jgi:hypothetical protein
MSETSEIDSSCFSFERPKQKRPNAPETSEVSEMDPSETSEVPLGTDGQSANSDAGYGKGQVSLTAVRTEAGRGLQSWPARRVDTTYLGNANPALNTSAPPLLKNTRATDSWRLTNARVPIRRSGGRRKAKCG